MLKDRPPAPRSLYEEILAQQFAKKGKKRPDSNSKQTSVALWSPDLAPMPKHGDLGSNTGKHVKKQAPKGCLSREERNLMVRVFARYAETKDAAGEPLLRLNKFKKLVHDVRLPLSSTTVELMFYGENRHQ